MNNQTLNEIIKRDLDACYFSITMIKSSIYFSFGNDLYYITTYLHSEINRYFYVFFWYSCYQEHP